MNIKSGIVFVLILIILFGEGVWFWALQNTKISPEKSYLNYPKKEMELLDDVKEEKILEDENIQDEFPMKKINLMIVAHPDDETLWGGAHLLEEDYHVVCVTCGNVKVRDQEFIKVMELTHNSYQFLGYPDLVNGYISNWQNEYDLIVKDLEKIIANNSWYKIVTHNPDGEYGHSHHKMISKMVTSVVPQNRLYYFGKYYTKENVPIMVKLDRQLFDRKVNELVSVYVSQPVAVKKHYHMLEYENFISYYNWY